MTEMDDNGVHASSERAPASISVAFRLGLSMHALNNEGNEGSNLMMPREIDLGGVIHDGLSGDIIRRHILENFVAHCRAAGDESLPMLPLSEMLHPDRGPFGIRHAARDLYGDKATVNADNVYASARAALSRCSVLDVGGLFAAWQDTADGIPEAVYQERNCAKVDKSSKPLTVKRDSCFSTAWAISEQGMTSSTPIHASYRPSGQNNLYTQTVRSGIYAGVIRVDLDRVGTDDYWCLQPGEDGNMAERVAIDSDERLARQKALIAAIFDYLAAPDGARTAGFAPHTSVVEGAVLVSSRRNAPFCSPVSVTPDEKGGVAMDADPGYAARMVSLAEAERGGWATTFSDVQEMLAVSGQAAERVSAAADNGGAS